MAGLLGDVLPYIYQRANALKRGIGDFVSDPVGSITQGVNYANDRAGGLLEATRAATDESIASGGLMYGPANKQLAGILANAYNPMGITVYHGSPHKFAKFDSSKIGTGEGAQVYGHGLYFAESPAVADGYKRSNMFGVQNAFKNTGGELPQIDEVAFLGRKIGGIAGDGAALRPVGAADPGMSVGLRRFPSDGTGSSLASLGYGATPAKLKAIAPDLTDNERAALQALINANGRADTAVEILRAKGRIEAAKIAQDAASGFSVTRMTDGTGNLYKVDLPDSAVARMLDWDKPLSQQAQNVKASLDALKKANPQGYQRLVDAQLGGPLMDQAAGMDLYRNLIKGANERQMAEVMRQQGIPGIRYLDGGPRGQGGGTSNFVIFPGEESLLTILERNGMPLPK